MSSRVSTTLDTNGIYRLVSPFPPETGRTLGIKKRLS